MNKCSCPFRPKEECPTHGKPTPPALKANPKCLEYKGDGFYDPCANGCGCDDTKPQSDVVRECECMRDKDMLMYVERSAYDRVVAELAEAFKGRDEQRDSALVLVEKWREASEKLATAKAALETYAKQADGVAHIARKALGEIGADSPSHMGFFGGEGVEK